MPDEDTASEKEAGYTAFDVKGDFNAPGAQIAGRDFTATSGPRLTMALDHAFGPLFYHVEQAPPPVRAEAQAKAEALKAEAAKGEAADDTRMATLLDDLVALVPGALQTVVAMFGQPLLSGLVGPLTQFVLNRLRKKAEAK